MNKVINTVKYMDQKEINDTNQLLFLINSADSIEKLEYALDQLNRYDWEKDQSLRREYRSILASKMDKFYDSSQVNGHDDNFSDW